MLYLIFWQGYFLYRRGKAVYAILSSSEQRQSTAAHKRKNHDKKAN